MPGARGIDGSLRVDLAVTASLCLFWLWFGYQYGFRNTPDSWYRGILARSIVEGHPFLVNIKQSYLYEFGAQLHPDAQHPPLIPILMAACFAVFGQKILFANLISCLSAGLIYLPLVRLSRMLCRTPLVAGLVYVFPIFIEGSSFLFETLGGLSIPTATFLLLSSLYAYSRIWYGRRLREAVIAGVLLACAALTRTDAQFAGFAWVGTNAVVAVVLWRRGDRQPLRQLAAFAAAYLLVLSPWLLRNALAFGNPVFTHPSLAAWTSNGSELYEYHESRPFPSAALYFSQHSVSDFLAKILAGLRTTYVVGSRDILPLGFWLPAFLVSLGYLLCRHARQRPLFLTLLAVAALCAGYCFTFSLAASAFLDDRFFIPLLFLLALTCFVAAITFAESLRERWAPGSARAGRALRVVMPCLVAVVTLHAQRDFWKGSFRKYLLHEYTGQDALAEKDPTIQGLRRQLPPDAVVLTPFAQTQRIGFLTGLSVVEEPVNLGTLKDPLAFFRRYGIGYSLVDLSGVLSGQQLAGLSLVGDAILFQVDLGGASKASPATAGSPPREAVARTIRQGKRENRVFIDARHGGLDPGFADLLAGMGHHVVPASGSLREEQDRLFHSGLLVLSYKMKGGTLDRDEWATVRTFTSSGGSVLLMCPVWVGRAYEQQPAAESLFNQIGGLYATLIVDEHPKGRVRSARTPLMPADAVEAQDWWGSFSRVVSTNPHAVPLFEDEQRRTFASAAVLGDSRAIVVGHNFMAQRATYAKEPRLVPLMQRWLQWLLQPGQRQPPLTAPGAARVRRRRPSRSRPAPRHGTGA